MQNAAIGFRAKTGRAIGVVLSGDPASPEFSWRGEVSLVDPAVPDSGQPYHAVMELPWSEATVAVQPLVSAIEAVAETALRALVDDMRSRQLEIRGAGIVGSRQRSLEKIGNQHIRAHAAEGILFRRVLEVSSTTNHLASFAFSEEELGDVASCALRSAAHVKSTMLRIGRIAGTPWRADERLAATAAWIALSRI
jgi:hypothetical protein